MIDEAQLLAAIRAIAPATKLVASDSPAAVQPPPKKGGKFSDRNKQWGEWAIEELVRSPELKLKGLAARVHKRVKDGNITAGTVQRCMGSIAALRVLATARRKALKTGG